MLVLLHNIFHHENITPQYIIAREFYVILNNTRYISATSSVLPLFPFFFFLEILMHILHYCCDYYMNPRCVSIIHQQFIIIFTWPLSIMSVSSKPSSCYICYKHEFVTTSDLRKHVTECVPTCAMFIKNSECSKCLQIFGDNWLFYLHLPQCVSTIAVLPTSHIMVPSTCTPLSLLSGGTVDKSGWIDPLSNKSLIPPNTPPLFFVMPLVDN